MAETLWAHHERVTSRADDPAAAAVRQNAAFGAIFIVKRSVYQDGLGTDIGKVETRVAFLAGYASG